MDFFKFFYKSNSMCKQSVSPNDLRNEPVEQNEATNIGLINVSSSSISTLSPLEIIEIIGFAILCILFCRWVWKFYTKQKTKKQVRERRQPVMATGSGNNRFMPSIEMLTWISQLGSQKLHQTENHQLWINIVEKFGHKKHNWLEPMQRMIENMEWILKNAILI